MWCCEVCTSISLSSQLKDTVPPSEAYLYGHINWSLTQAYQQSSLGLSQMLTSVRCGRANQKLGSGLMFYNWPVLESGATSFRKKSHLGIRTESNEGAVSQLGCICQLQWLWEELQPWGMAFLMCYFTASSPSTSSVVQLGSLPKFLGQ